MAEKVQQRSEIEHVPGEKEVQDFNSLSLKGEAQEIDRALEKKVLRKTDLHLVPILFLLFLCAFIDRWVSQDWVLQTPSWRLLLLVSTLAMHVSRD
jgi:hypothetical protein